MTGVAYARGRYAWGTCQKCGFRFPFLELRDDGYFKHLRVCKDCYDGPHPQERLLRVADPVALWRGTPDTVYPPTVPVLEPVVLIGNDVELAWSASTSPDSGVAGYRVLRSPNEDDYTLVVDLPVTRDAFATITNEPLAYTDVDLTPGTYSYLIRAYDMRNPAMVSGNSNIVLAAVP